MLIFLSILLLFSVPIIILVLDRFRVRAGYLWFFALGGALTAWILILVARLQSPTIITLMQWRPATLFSATPALLLDEISWVYAAALAAFPLAVLLTDILRFTDVDPQAWAASLAMTGLGLLAVFAGNPLTLMLAWAVADLSETFLLLQRVPTSGHRERVVVALSVRLVGLLLVLAATLQALSLGTALVFDAIPAEVSGLLLLAVGLRLGVLPPHQPFFQEPPLRRGLGTIVRLTPVTSCLVVLARVAHVGVPASWQPYLLAVGVAAALYGGFAWFQAPNELDGRPYWILGMATMALVSAVYRLPDASMAWGVALLASGGILFLISYRSRFVSALAFLGIISFSLFPFTPAWRGGILYSHSGFFLVLLFVLAHALLLLGYARHLLQKPPPGEGVERWMLIVCPLGLILLVIAHWGIALSHGLARGSGLSMNSVGWWGGIVAFCLAVVFLFLRKLQFAMLSSIATGLRGLLSLEWMYRLFWWLYHTASRFFSSISLILEGEGGVLWSLIMLILLVSLMIQLSGGG
ncbi:MAG: hypothetical protein FJ010_02870 [Chloroflexi bacterium]|nr:hypothetical protein [Chloroflexota bacterium]